MTGQQGDEAANAACGVGAEGLKCAVVSWAAPLAAAVILVLGMYVPALSVLNIVFVAFGLMATVRSIGHIRQYGSCGLGGHLAVGIVLNAVVVTLVLVYIFTALDPLSIRVK